MRAWIAVALTAAALAAAAWAALDLRRIASIRAVPADPPAKAAADIDGLLAKLERGGRYDEAVDHPAVDGACDFVDARWDTADFRLPTLARLLWLHGGELGADAAARIRRTLLDFKYWIDQGGPPDSMCYWSENHQALFATGEYLAGRMYPDAIFTNDGRTGREHAAIARERLMAWLGQRWRYGFIEWYSNTYYVEDVAPLADLVDFAGEERAGTPADPELALKATIVLDLLLHDLASQSWKGVFVSTMGRAYERGKKGGEGDSMRSVSSWAFGLDRGPPRSGMDLNLTLSRKYRVPAAIRAIALDDREAVIKASTGLDLRELRGEGLMGTRTPQIMMLWGMEAFTNPEAIHATVNYAHDLGLFSNEFLHELSMVDLGLLRETGLLPLVSRALRPATDGVAIQRADTYTYRTPYFQLATAQRHHPGEFGDQQHIWSATLSPSVSVFTTHPAKSLADRGALSGSPGYWVGNGRNPDAAQDRNVVLAIYDLPSRKGFMEKAIVPYTHAYFPRARLRDVSIEGGRAFGRAGDAWIALAAPAPLEYAEGSDEDLIQRGAREAWVCELGSPATDPGFEAFKARVSANALSFDPERRSLAYETGGRRLELVWGGAFSVDGKAAATSYPRFDSPWASAPREPGSMTFRAGGRELELSFDPPRRVER